MAHIKAIGPQLIETLKKYSADHMEVHLEERHTSHITYRGSKLQFINRSTAIAGNARAVGKRWPEFRQL